jgi:thiazole synthase
MPADPVLAKRLEEAGCAAVMPLGSAIGTGHGLATLEMLRLIVADSGVPVIVDAGLRAPSEAAAAMELGCGAVLVNSAIAAAGNPVAMAGAFRTAVEAGRAARLAGLMARSATASATSPLTSFIGGS